MKITTIKQQQKRTDRYSVFVDEKYAFSLSEAALLQSGLASGHELSKGQLEDYKRLSADDKLYNAALRYVAMRPRSSWEVHTYLTRKDASPALIDEILSKLSEIDLLNDRKFADAFVHDRRLLRPTSRRKIIMELRKKHVADEIISEAVGAEADADSLALQQVIERKRRQAKYHDDQKLMQYLARQGFGYEDIKSALSNSPE